MLTPTLASAAVVGVGALWGLYWLPLRGLAEAAPLGPWLTVIVLAVACFVLAPAGWLGRHRLRSTPWQAVASACLGGLAFVLYSDGLLYGHVAVVILMFYLTPVWSSLIARFWLGRRVAWWRWLAIGCGFAGILLVLHGSEGGLPVPHQLGDWLGLASGLLWAIASTGMHQSASGRPAERNFVFCCGAMISALVIALLLGTGEAAAQAEPAPGTALAWALLIGGVWWAGSLTLFLAATQQLEPPRVGILLMSEVIVGAASAALLAAEPFGPLMACGTVLVVGAGVIETLPEPGSGWSAREPPA
jgi:drug/metabolite transporter (DMT)-like permease